MKAIVFERYGPPSVLTIKDMTKPTPKDNEVLIRVLGAAITSADASFRKGDPVTARLAVTGGLFTPKKPILGTELAGRIEAIGKDVSRFQVGDEIFASTGLVLALMPNIFAFLKPVPLL